MGCPSFCCESGGWPCPAGSPIAQAPCPALGGEGWACQVPQPLQSLPRHSPAPPDLTASLCFTCFTVHSSTTSPLLRPSVTALVCSSFTLVARGYCFIQQPEKAHRITSPPLGSRSPTLTSSLTSFHPLSPLGSSGDTGQLAVPQRCQAPSRHLGSACVLFLHLFPSRHRHHPSNVTSLEKASLIPFFNIPGTFWNLRLV